MAPTRGYGGLILSSISKPLTKFEIARLRQCLDSLSRLVGCFAPAEIQGCTGVIRLLPVLFPRHLDPQGPLQQPPGDAASRDIHWGYLAGDAVSPTFGLFFKFCEERWLGRRPRVRLHFGITDLVADLWRLKYCRKHAYLERLHQACYSRT